MASVVVFPAPLGPNSPTISPSSTENVIPSTAVHVPKFFVKLLTETIGVLIKNKYTLLTRVGKVRYRTGNMKKLFFLLALALLLPAVVLANHSWGGYHWARTANSFTLKLGDNVTGSWEAYLSEASSDWSQSSVLDTTIVAGNGGKNCKPTAGRIEVCNRKYGNNGWLGLAQIWLNGSHITQALAKMNDTYFNLTRYNTPAWKRLVMCQEVAHGFGLDHQDENHNNANLGSCMDYTGDPDGPPSNEHPNAHDYEMLESIYAHLDATSTVDYALATGANHGKPAFVDAILDEPSDWGRKVKGNENVSVYERDFGGGNKIHTFVIWAKD